MSIAMMGFRAVGDRTEWMIARSNPDSITMPLVERLVVPVTVRLDPYPFASYTAERLQAMCNLCHEGTVSPPRRDAVEWMRRWIPSHDPCERPGRLYLTTGWEAGYGA